jgi:two-component system cell cycle sensor histidine kinase/response regulator CckA
MARRIAGLRPNVRIVFMSGYTGDPLVRPVEPGPSMFLSKPFTSAALMDKIREALNGPWNGLPDIRHSGPASDRPSADS